MLFFSSDWRELAEIISYVVGNIFCVFQAPAVTQLPKVMGITQFNKSYKTSY